MSVYKRGDSPFYHYDLPCQGDRFHGSTGCGKKSEAREFERRRKLEALALIAPQASAGRSGDMTLDIAAGRFWLERGQL